MPFIHICNTPLSKLKIFSFFETDLIHYKIKSSISFAKAIISPPKKDRKPLLFCVGSCPCTPEPICTTPQPRIITPTALIAANTNVERLLIAANGSVPTAKALVVQNSMEHKKGTESFLFLFYAQTDIPVAFSICFILIL